MLTITAAVFLLALVYSVLCIRLDRRANRSFRLPPAGIPPVPPVPRRPDLRSLKSQNQNHN